MAIPVGPASRPKRRHAPVAVDSSTESAADTAAASVAERPDAAPAEVTPTRPAAPTLATRADSREDRPAPAVRSVTTSVRAATRPATGAGAFASQALSLQHGRSPSEIIAREALSPAVLALSLVDFFELLYQEQMGPSHVTVEEFLRMRDSGIWPELFTAGDPCALFTEQMCRRGQFVPLAWHQDGLAFATCKDDSSQDDLAKALDLLVRAPVTLFTVPAESVDAGVHWLFHRRMPA